MIAEIFVRGHVYRKVNRNTAEFRCNMGTVRIRGQLPDWTPIFFYKLKCRIFSGRVPGNTMYTILRVIEKKPRRVNYENFEDIIESYYDIKKPIVLSDVKLSLDGTSIDGLMPLIRFDDNSNYEIHEVCSDLERLWPTVFSPDNAKNKAYRGIQATTQLNQLWDPKIIDQLNLEQTISLLDEYLENPVSFCLPNTKYKTPALLLDDRSREIWKNVLKRDITDLEERAYPACRAFSTNSQTTSVSIDFYQERDAIDAAIELKCLVPTTEDRTRLVSTCDDAIMRELGVKLKALLECKIPVPAKAQRPKSAPPELNKEQTQAYQNADHVRLLILVGEAGTGKTLTCQLILKHLIVMNILVVAVTSLAVMNFRTTMEKRTKKNLKGLTVDSLIEHARRKTKRYEKYAKNTHVLHIEEASQITALQLLELLRVLPNLRQVIINGDHFQNGPIGRESSILPSMIEHFGGGLVVTTLLEIKRNDAPFLQLAKNCSALREGRWRDMENVVLGDERQAFVTPFVLVHRKLTIRESVYRLMDLIKSANIELNDVAIITHKNSTVAELNKHVFFALNEMFDETKYDPKDIFVGEKVLIRENHPGTEEKDDPRCSTSFLSNGSIYRISEIVDVDTKKKCEIRVASTRARRSSDTIYSRVVRFDDDTVTQINLSHYSIENLIRGYAFTIHALQGSEIDHVLYYIHEGFTEYHDRRLQYVACSRARKSIVVECAFAEGATNLLGSDVVRICGHEPTQPDVSLVDYLPTFRGDEMYFDSVRTETKPTTGKRQPVSSKSAPSNTVKRRKTDSYSANESSDLTTNSGE